MEENQAAAPQEPIKKVPLIIVLISGAFITILN